MDQEYGLIFQVSIATDTEKQLQYYVSIIFKYISDNATQFYMPHRSIIFFRKLKPNIWNLYYIKCTYYKHMIDRVEQILFPWHKIEVKCVKFSFSRSQDILELENCRERSTLVETPNSCPLIFDSLLCFNSTPGMEK